jgi:phage protein D
MGEKTNLTPAFIVYAGGKRLDTECEGALKTIAVYDRLNGVSTVSLLFDTAGVKIGDKGIFSLENEIKIHLGYKDDTAEVFSGEITGFKAVFSEWGEEKFEVSGTSVLHRLAHAAHFRHFEKKSASAVIKGLIEGYSLKADVDSFGTAQDFSAEAAQNDYEYVLQNAEVYGKQVFACGTTIYVKNEITVSRDEIIYEWGKNLSNFEASVNIRKLLSRSEYIGWDTQKASSFSGSAGLKDVPVKIGGSKDWTSLSKGGGGKWVQTGIDLSLKDGDSAKQKAAGILQTNSFLFCQASGKGEGNCKLRPGMRVKIKNAGKLFEGEYIADSVTHSFNDRKGYTTTFTLKRNMTP